MSQLDTRELSRLTDYVVAYNCKGASTTQEERESMRVLIEMQEELHGNNRDVRSVAQKIMNKAATQRVIPKQEACVLLGRLPLVDCTEQTTVISTSFNKKITINKKSEDTSLIQKYATRSTALEHLSLEQFHYWNREQKKLPATIPLFTGTSCKPTFPISAGYARHALIVHKPWREYPANVDHIKEFNKFIYSGNCSTSAKMDYERAMQRFFNGTKFVDPKAADYNNEDPDNDKDVEAMLMASLHASFTLDDHPLEKGLCYDWSSSPKMVSKLHIMFFFYHITQCYIYC